jgi:hypothetical protein
MRNKFPNPNNTLIEDVMGLPATSNDAMLTCSAEKAMPLPCIVILIHGVNDIGEAFGNLDEKICEGLNKRLGRNDIKPNRWQWVQDTKDDFSPRIQMLTEWIDPETKEKQKGNSPVIPFYWGYRPVDIETYYKEQQAYKTRLEKGNPEELPYDAYWIEQETKELAELFEFAKLNCDHFGNWLDAAFRRNGGPFSDATTCIPDMYGPGLTSLTNYMAKFGSSLGAKAYDNPHRIYMVFAAYRLANLIKKIRTDKRLSQAPVNIVAHSQGTIITMLANMILAEDKFLPADCVILAHSPYAFEPSYLEEQSKEWGMGVQTAAARQQTFINFVQKMKDGQKFRETNYDEPNILIEKGVAFKATNSNQLMPSQQHYDFTDPRYCRDNFGKVYNYFSPNDQVVSLNSVQGMGWQGIPNHVFNRCGDNLRQRVFSHRVTVGDDPNKFICFRPSGSFEFAFPAYLDKNELKNRYIEMINKYHVESEHFERMIVSLDKNHLALVNQHERLVNASFVSGYYDIKKDKIVLTYKLDEKIVSELKNDEKNYSSFETGSKEIFKLETYTNARFVVKEKLNINGEQVPEPIIYTVSKDLNKTELAKAIYYSDLFIKNRRYAELKHDYTSQGKANAYPKYQFYYDGPDRPIKYYKPSITLPEYQRVLTKDNSWVAAQIKAHPEWQNVDHIRFTYDPYQFEVWCLPSDEEIKANIYQEIKKQAESKEENSHHSGITLNEQVPSHIMAYDLALGEVKDCGQETRQTWQRLIHLADWRSPENEDSEIINYSHYGILPDQIKKSMNFLQGKVPDGVVNEFKHVTSLMQQATIGAVTTTVKLIAHPITKSVAQVAITVGDKVLQFYIDPKQQWPLPEPDTKRNT